MPAEGSTSRSNKNKNTSGNGDGLDVNEKKGSRGPYAKISAKKRAHIVRQFIATRAPIRQIATANRLAESSVRNIIKTYREEDRIEPKPRGGTRVEALIDDNVSEFIHQRIMDNTSITLQQLREMIAQEFNGLDISLTTIHRHCNEKIVFTLKCISPLPEIRNDEYTLEARRHFALELSQRQLFYVFNCIFIGAASFHISQIRKFGRARKDFQSINVIDTNRSSNIHVLAAISYFGVEQIYADIVDEETASTTFIQFLKTLMKKLETKVIAQCIVIDNIPILNTPKVKEWIEDYQKTPTIHIIRFLPPHTPYLNPVHQLFSKLTTYVKKKDLSMNSDILDRITKAGEMVTRKDCEEWVSHSGSLLDNCA